MDERELSLQRAAAFRGEEILTLIEDGMPSEANLRMEVTIVLPRINDSGLRIGLRIGLQKWYVVKDIPTFIQAWRMGIKLDFQNKFIYEPSWMQFREEDEKILKQLERMISSYEIGKWLPSQGEARLMRLPETVAEELLDSLRNLPFRIMKENGKTLSVSKIIESSIPVQIECRMTPRGLHLMARLPGQLIPLTENCAFLLNEEQVIATETEQQALLRFLLERQEEGMVMMDFPLQATERVVGEVLPYLKLRSAVEMSEELRKMLVRLPLKARIYLDRDGKSVAARVSFHYGNRELNPFAPVQEKIALEKGEKLLLRDAEGEHIILDILGNAGFRVGSENIRLSRPEEIFMFLTEGVQKLGKVSEVYLSKEFRKMIIRRPTIRSGLKMEDGSLLMSLSIDDYPSDEVLGIIEALSKARQYYRMKDGTFLDLEGLEKWQEPAESIYEAVSLDDGRKDRDALVLKSYRAGYLMRLLAEKGLQVDADQKVQELADELNGEKPVPEAPKTDIPLRDYQKRGYEWMYTMDRLHMGGILADDMGLGKTVQVIALLKVTREVKRCSLIVAPTSLTYNWLSEIRRFAPELSAAVITGTIAQRERMWQHVTQHSDVDVVITSYPLIRRDISWIDDYSFRFAILDEAQNIKNTGSLVASAVKKIQADTRLALTGTPMENGVGELWSIFDFALPGYLPGYSAFLRRYQDGMNSEDLRNRIRPFLVRRLKQEVLSELPDKIETRMTAAMTQEQRNVYQAAMERLRPRIKDIMNEKGLHKGRMEVLSAITELRQICCNPALVLDGYQGGSGKEEMLQEMLPNLIAGGRRILIFSQFTSMLKLLRPRLELAGFKTLYLDGDTPAGDRLELTERFNSGEGQIFLISLRAGGSGLNLTGADVVIHYDPWWNPAAEDQATDRAHRIGQTKKVNVIRLVMGDSIEEKVVELGERKKALFDKLIVPGESGLTAFSEQEIRDLFA